MNAIFTSLMAGSNDPKLVAVVVRSHIDTGRARDLYTRANAIRKDLGRQVIRDVNRLLKESIRYGLEHRDEALQYALQYGRDLDRQKADTFVGMYVNDWTLDFGPRGRQAVRELLARGYQAGVIPHLAVPEFVEAD